MTNTNADLDVDVDRCDANNSYKAEEKKADDKAEEQCLSSSSSNANDNGRAGKAIGTKSLWKNKWPSRRKSSRSKDNPEQDKHTEEEQLPLSEGDTIGMLINRREVKRDPYEISFSSSSNIYIKFRSIPTRTDENVGVISFPIPANPMKKAKEAILVVGFFDYDLDLSERPELGARLVAIDSLSIEQGDWTLDKVQNVIASHDKSKQISLTFRNDLLSTEDISHLNSILVRRKSSEDDIDNEVGPDNITANPDADDISQRDRADDEEQGAQFDKPENELPPLSPFSSLRRSSSDSSRKSVVNSSPMANERPQAKAEQEPDEEEQQDADQASTPAFHVAVPLSPSSPISPTSKSEPSSSTPCPSPDVFEYFAATQQQQGLTIHGGRIVSEDDDDRRNAHHDSMSSNSSIFSSDGEFEGDCDGSSSSQAKPSAGSITENGVDTSAAAPTSRPNMADIFASAVPSARQNPSLFKKAQSLGWRNRYSQAEFYPVEINTPCTISISSTPISYHVGQVQRGETDGTYGTGATVWPASLVLLKYLELAVSKDPSLLKSKTVIDLGAGTCITSIAAALLGAELVVCTDGNDHVVSLAEDIVDKACKDLKSSLDAKVSSDGRKMIGECELRVRKFWWGKDDESMLDELASYEPEESRRRYYDIILVSDCVLPKLYPIEPLVLAISNLSGPDTVTYLSYEHRYYAEYDPRDRFRDLAIEKGLRVRVVPIDEQDPVYSVDDIEIWEVKKER